LQFSKWPQFMQICRNHNSICTISSIKNRWRGQEYYIVVNFELFVGTISPSFVRRVLRASFSHLFIFSCGISGYKPYLISTTSLCFLFCSFFLLLPLHPLSFLLLLCLAETVALHVIPPNTKKIVEIRIRIFLNWNIFFIKNFRLVRLIISKSYKIWCYNKLDFFST